MKALFSLFFITFVSQAMAFDLTNIKQEIESAFENERLVVVQTGLSDTRAVPFVACLYRADIKKFEPMLGSAKISGKSHLTREDISLMSMPNASLFLPLCPRK